MADAPVRTSDGVLGMARTTAMPSPSAPVSAAVVTPAAMDSTRCTPTPASVRQVSATSLGFTAITAPSAASGSARTATPGNSISSC